MDYDHLYLVKTVCFHICKIFLLIFIWTYLERFVFYTQKEKEEEGEDLHLNTVYNNNNCNNY